MIIIFTVSSRPTDFPGTKRKLPPVSNVSYLIAEERLNVIRTQPLGQVREIY